MTRTPPPRSRLSAALLAAAALGAGAAQLLGACGSPTAPSPFDPAGSGGAAGQGGGMPFDAGPDADPTIGGPCTVDAQCDDGIACTFDRCDPDIDRCRFTPDDSQCQNDQYCDGLELCDLQIGCRLGEPVSCSDGQPCTIDTCNEELDSCDQVPRDADGDGDPDAHCGGGDCDDLDPQVSSEEYEVCGNGRDDDCDGQLDELACFQPANDKCLDPLDLTAPGSYPMSTAAAGLDYSASCTVADPVLARDVVAAVPLAAGPPLDVQLTARTDSADVALALMGQCGQAASEIACSAGYAHPAGGRVAKVRGRSVGDSMLPSALAVYVTTQSSSNVTLKYEQLPASTKPQHETCGTAAPLVPSTPTLASVVDAALDLATACSGSATGELVYSFELTSAQDVDLYATSVDGDGRPALSLRTAACALPSDEIACNVASSAHIFRHSLAPGTYHVAVSASAPTEVLLTLELSPPTAPPADESCAGAPPIPPNQTIDVSLAGHQDDHHPGCLPGGVDAAYTLDLAEPSDLLLIGRYSQNDAAAVVLAQPACGPADGLACGTSSVSPARARKRNVPAGSYRVLAESALGQPMQLTALARPAVPPTIVPFANGCADVVTIPSTGGFFQGSTANAQPDFDAGCDLGGQPPGGAPDQILQLTLTAPKRVVLDMLGSGYSTLLSVREGPSCPGNEIPGACAAGFYPERSFLDLTLQPATYFILIDGYAGNQGPWFLDVHVVDP